MRLLVLLLLFCFWIPSGCKKGNDNPRSGKKIEFYLLKSYTKVTGSDAIAANSIVLNDTALINYEDILWYDDANYIFKITETPAKWLNDFQHNQSHGKAFAVTIDKKIIYTGYFWASFSSSSCNWIVVDPLNYAGKNELTVRIGYPGLMAGTTIPDNRNNAELLEILGTDKKLK
jgi:hypothetical protein